MAKRRREIKIILFSFLGNWWFRKGRQGKRKQKVDLDLCARWRLVVAVMDEICNACVIHVDVAKRLLERSFKDKKSGMERDTIDLVESRVDNLTHYIQSSVIKMYRFLTPVLLNMKQFIMLL